MQIYILLFVLFKFCCFVYQVRGIEGESDQEIEQDLEEYNEQDPEQCYEQDDVQCSEQDVEEDYVEGYVENESR